VVAVAISCGARRLPLGLGREYPDFRHRNRSRRGARTPPFGLENLTDEQVGRIMFTKRRQDTGSEFLSHEQHRVVADLGGDAHSGTR